MSIGYKPYEHELFQWWDSATYMYGKNENLKDHWEERIEAKIHRYDS